MGLSFYSVLILLLKCCVLLWLIMYCYMVTERFLIAYYTLLYFISIISASSKAWTWLQLGHTQNMGVVAPRALLVKIFTKHHWCGRFSSLLLWRLVSIVRLAFRSVCAQPWPLSASMPFWWWRQYSVAVKLPSYMHALHQWDFIGC